MEKWKDARNGEDAQPRGWLGMDQSGLVCGASLILAHFVLADFQPFQPFQPCCKCLRQQQISSHEGVLRTSYPRFSRSWLCVDAIHNSLHCTNGNSKFNFIDSQDSRGNHTVTCSLFTREV